MTDDGCLVCSSHAAAWNLPCDRAMTLMVMATPARPRKSQRHRLLHCLNSSEANSVVTCPQQGDQRTKHGRAVRAVHALSSMDAVPDNRVSKFDGVRTAAKFVGDSGA